MDLDALIKLLDDRARTHHLSAVELAAFAQVLATREQTDALRGATNELCQSLQYVGQ